MIEQFEQMILPITEFRHKMTETLEELKLPRILMNRDKPKAVIVPYEMFKAMEIALEDQMDYILGVMASKRLDDKEATYIPHNKFWEQMEKE